MAKNSVLKKIVNFLFELNVLRRIPRSGWRNIGIENPESVAEHAFSTAQIAYILGKMEKVKSERAALIALFHDNGEVRIGDFNLLAKLYLKTNEGEERAFLDQIRDLPGQKEIKKLYQEWKEQKTSESIVAKDADHLELIIQAKNYLDLGNNLAKIWIKYHRNFLKTKSAKRLAEIIEKTKIDDWWKEIPEIKSEVKKVKNKKSSQV